MTSLSSFSQGKDDSALSCSPWANAGVEALGEPASSPLMDTVKGPTAGASTPTA
jgi:hypothetical protein